MSDVKSGRESLPNSLFYDKYIVVEFVEHVERFGTCEVDSESVFITKFYAER